MTRARAVGNYLILSLSATLLHPSRWYTIGCPRSALSSVRLDKQYCPSFWSRVKGGRGGQISNRYVAQTGYPSGGNSYQGGATPSKKPCKPFYLCCKHLKGSLTLYSPFEELLLVQLESHNVCAAGQECVCWKTDTLCPNAPLFYPHV